MDAKLLQLVKENRPLFWSVGEENLQNLNDSSVVETVLNFGNIENVRTLFSTLGLQKTADIFYAQLSGKRNNYYPQASHFFDVYFKRHVQKYSQS